MTSPLGLLAGLLSPREEADLLSHKKANKNRNAFAPKRIYIPKARWITTHLEIILKRQTCLNCGHIHTDPNTLILAVETSIDGRTTRKSSTLPEATLNDLDLAALPFETSVLELTALPFCSLCIDELDHQTITRQFLHQQTKEGINDLQPARPSIGVPEPLDLDGPDTPIDLGDL